MVLMLTFRPDVQNSKCAFTLDPDVALRKRLSVTCILLEFSCFAAHLGSTETHVLLWHYGVSPCDLGDAKHLKL